MSTPAKKLNSGAKAFVPGSSTLKASAASWTPTPSKDDKADKKESSAPAPTKTAASVVAAPAPAKKEAAPAKPAAPAPSVWGKKASSAVRAAPSEEQKAKIETPRAPQEHRQHGRRHQNNRDDKGGWSRGKKQQDNNWSRGKKQTKKEDDGWQRGKLVPLDLLKPGEGDTDAMKAVARVNVGELLAMRLSYVAPPLAWERGDVQGPPKDCLWVSETRVQEIDAIASKQRMGGDVSHHRRKKKETETAPPLEECKPLEINEDTRWKAGIFKENKEDEDSDEVVMKKALLILNKLSLTKFDKLSDAFIATGIGRNAECLGGAIELIVKKAQDEPHFSAMYAALCLKLSRTPMDFEEPGKKKKFKKMLLTECQKEFETDTNTKIEKAIEGIEDEEERELKTNIIKKHYLGHMRFIGELYKGDLISIKIMLMVLPQLLEINGEVVDEEKVECFAKLMTVIGLILEQQSVALRDIGKADPYEKLVGFWESIKKFAGNDNDGPKVSNRIKFMLQDLLEMKDNGWATRRKEESAKTIAQIHKEAAKEARRNSSGMNRSTSTNSLRRQASAPVPIVDKDGFTEVVGPAGGFNRSQSLGNFKRTNSRNNLKKKSSLRSSMSSRGSFAALDEPQILEEPSSKNSTPKIVDKKVKVEYLTPKECGDKAKNYFKEFFVGGDADDAVLSIHELIGAGDGGSVDRGAKIVESCILMVLEMKAEDVEKFLSIICRCYNETKLEKASVSKGLNDPLEFLSDVAIDAPLATSHMATIISAFVKADMISFDYLLSAPEYFRTDCDAASFGCKVLKAMGGDATAVDSNVEVIEKLMTEDDKAQYPTAKDLIAA